jgi:hypothetical protein
MGYRGRGGQQRGSGGVRSTGASAAGGAAPARPPKGPTPGSPMVSAFSTGISPTEQPSAHCPDMACPPTSLQTEAGSLHQASGAASASGLGCHTSQRQLIIPSQWYGGACTQANLRMPCVPASPEPSGLYSLHLPWVLLRLRAAPKEDSAISSAELVFGAALTLPGQFLAAMERSPANYVKQLQSSTPLPTRLASYAEAAASVPEKLMKAEYVFVRRSGVVPPLAHLYQGRTKC